MAETRARFLANTIGATSASNDFTLPDGVGTDKQVLSSNGAGGTTWADTLSAPAITSVTGTLNEYEDGVSEDGGVLTINGTDFGNDASALSVQISGTTGFAVVAETTTISITASGTQFTATFTGAETNYNHSSFAAGTNIYVRVTKSGLQTSTYATLGTAMTGDPSFSTTSTTASTHTGTLPATSLGSYGGQVAGGGDDSNTKLLLNFDRTGGTDIEDSSNIGGDGHKVTATNAVIKASPFGDGKSAVFFDGSSDYLQIGNHADFALGTSMCIEAWVNLSSTSTHDMIMSYGGDGSTGTAGWYLMARTSPTDLIRFAHHTGSSETSLDFTHGWNVGEWHHIAVTRDGTTFRMFADGVLKASTTSGDLLNASPTNSSKDLFIGKPHDTAAWYFDGYMDEIRIVNGSAVYTGDFTPPTSRLTAITNTKLLIHSNHGDGGVFLGGAVAKNITVTKSTGTVFQDTGNFQELVNGDRSSNNFYWSSTDSTNNGYYDFECNDGKSVVINGFRFIQSGTTSRGTWVLEASNDNFTNTQTLQSAFTLGGATTQTKTFTNTTAYKKFRLRKTSGDVTNQGYVHELEFFNNAFTDSSSSSHNIAATGSEHSQAHGGIAPALTFPASLKKTGSAGMYFDGVDDYLSSTLNSAIGTSSFTFECFVYPLSNSPDAYNGRFIVDARNSSNLDGFWVNFDKTSGQVSTGTPDGTTVTQTNSAHYLNFNQWNHLAVVRNASTGYKSIYVRGTRSDHATYTISDADENLTSTDLVIGRFRGGDYDFQGYLDNIRLTYDAKYTNSTLTVPTKIYGAYHSQDVGTIQLNASAGTGGGALDYAELSGGTALSTYGLSLSSSGAITGTLSGLAENSNSGGVVRIRARANADDNRVTTLGGSSFTGITQNGGKAPVLFSARRYHGSGVNSARDINGFGLQPDLVWIKNRDNASFGHALVDSVKGHSAFLSSDSSGTPTSNSNVASQFNADGFSTGSSFSGYSNGDEAYMAWAWKAGGAPTATNSGGQSPTSGSVMIDGSASTANLASASIYPNKMSVNTEAGFSIVTYDGVRSSAGADTIPHGLGSAPDLIIIKQFSGSSTFDWSVGHSSTNLQASSGFLKLNSNGALDSSWDDFGASPDANVFTTQYSGRVNASGREYVAYCWKAVSGVSEFGSYTVSVPDEEALTKTVSLNDNTLTPKLIILKSLQTGSWYMFDSFRGFATDSSASGNPAGFLRADLPDVESTPSTSQGYIYDVTAGSFKVRGDIVGLNHRNSSDMIYMAFA